MEQFKPAFSACIRVAGGGECNNFSIYVISKAGFCPTAFNYARGTLGRRARWGAISSRTPSHARGTGEFESQKVFKNEFRVRQVPKESEPCWLCRGVAGGVAGGVAKDIAGSRPVSVAFWRRAAVAVLAR